MSKLSPALKELINAPFSRPGPAPAPAGIRLLFERLRGEAVEKDVGPRQFLAMMAATSFTLNSPGSLEQLFLTSTASTQDVQVRSAELIREVGLKCISFNGIPRTINCLGAFRASLPPPIIARLETRPSRRITPENITAANARGLKLWTSVYDPFETKLLGRLADSHPDLPVHILGSHYAPLLSDPEGDRGGLPKTGRVITSLIAIACLRAQTGVGPQVLSHIFGLRKAVEQGLHVLEVESAKEKQGVEWMASDEGSEWILRSVDAVSETIGSNFAPGTKAKL